MCLLFNFQRLFHRFCSNIFSLSAGGRSVAPSSSTSSSSASGSMECWAYQPEPCTAMHHWYKNKAVQLMCFYNFYMQSHWSRKNHTLQFFWGLGHDVPILYRRFGPVLGSVMFHVTFRFRVVTKRSCCASMRADLQWNKDEQRLNSLPSLPGLITYIYI